MSQKLLRIRRTLAPTEDDHGAFAQRTNEKSARRPLEEKLPADYGRRSVSLRAGSASGLRCHLSPYTLCLHPRSSELSDVKPER